MEHENRYQAHDNNIELLDSRDIYTLSCDFWNMYVTRYHADIVI